MSSFARAHTNLALVKYWGKADEDLRLPAAPSLSLTLDAFYTETRVSCARKDKFILDGKEAQGPEADRVFSYLRRLFSFFSLPLSPLLVESQNFVPKSAGFASSASAFCALAAAFSQEFELNLTRSELSIASRLGSGSACRSVYGGFCEWKEGGMEESFAIPIDEHPSMGIAVLYLSFGSEKKGISSTEGMRRSKSSPFFPVWRQECRKACREAKEAIAEADFEKLGEVAEKNACQMHALTLSSGFSYLSSSSFRALSFAQSLRERGTACYWSCDAGKNAALLCRERDLAQVKEEALSALGPKVLLFASGPGPGVEAEREV
ncbi:MAG: diphosphomevalonate decarboxylase [Aeriscardovia sp.]|nr:diphosphomevalonate decarboxylase [Aeriscardovia sp.]